MNFETNSPNIKYSVIVPAYNAESTLHHCLKALAGQSVSQQDYEVIVVDDGSTDATATVAKGYDTKYIFQVNQGPATARNKGATMARGTIILFTDSDCVPDSHWIEEMVRPFDQPEIVGVKGAYKSKQRQLAARFAQAEFEDRYDLLQKSQFIDMIDTYSAAFRKDIFLDVGGFDQNFPVANNEDTDLSYRLVKEGCRLVFNPGAFVYHSHPRTLIEYLKLKLRRGFWRMMVYKRHPTKAVKDSYTPTVIKIQTVLVVASLPILLFSWFIPTFLQLGLLCWGVIIISTLPFALKTFRKDKPVGLIAPVVVFLRSLAFALGSLLGFVRSLSFPSFEKNKISEP